MEEKLNPGKSTLPPNVRAVLVDLHGLVKVDLPTFGLETLKRRRGKIGQE
jgi:hypothetical protein